MSFPFQERNDYRNTLCVEEKQFTLPSHLSLFSYSLTKEFTLLIHTPSLLHLSLTCPWQMKGKAVHMSFRFFCIYYAFLLTTYYLILPVFTLKSGPFSQLFLSLPSKSHLCSYSINQETFTVSLCIISQGSPPSSTKHNHSLLLPFCQFFQCSV